MDRGDLEAVGGHREPWQGRDGRGGHRTNGGSGKDSGWRGSTGQRKGLGWGAQGTSVERGDERGKGGGGGLQVGSGPEPTPDVLAGQV